MEKVSNLYVIAYRDRGKHFFGFFANSRVWLSRSGFFLFPCSCCGLAVVRLIVSQNSLQRKRGVLDHRLLYEH